MKTAECLERLRMAVAEAGYDPECVLHETEPTKRYRIVAPRVVGWRARETAFVGKPLCRECCFWMDRTYDEVGDFPPRRCLAARRFTEDCGVDR